MSASSYWNKYSQFCKFIPEGRDQIRMRYELRIMKQVILAIILIFAAFSLGFGQSKPTVGKDEQAVRNFVDQFAAAFQNNDAAALDRLFAPDYVFVNPAGAIQNKHQRVEEVRSGDRKYELARYDEVVVHLYGSTAIVTARVTTKATNKGVDSSGQFRSTLTLVKIKDKWQLVASQANSIPQR